MASPAQDHANFEKDRLIQERLKHQKDQKRIDLNIKEGLQRSTLLEISRKKADLRTLLSKSAQVKFAEENDERRIHGLEQKVDQEKTIERRMENDVVHKRNFVAQKEKGEQEMKVRIEKLEGELSILKQEMDRKERELKRLQGDTSITTDKRKAEQEELKVKQHIDSQAMTMRKIQEEINRFREDAARQRHEYEEFERKIHDMEREITQLESNEKDYAREIQQLRREVR
jgi:chromosome segregation ATPase